MSAASGSAVAAPGAPSTPVPNSAWRETAPHRLRLAGHHQAQDLVRLALLLEEFDLLVHPARGRGRRRAHDDQEITLVQRLAQ
jgi:hypothetical protein